MIATYNYTDAEGTLHYQVLRKSDKTFVQREQNGRGGWIWDMKDTTRVLYNLPYLLGYPMEDWVFVVEGEKNINNLRLHNLAGTTNSGGAGKWHLVADLSAFDGRRVAIIPDNDNIGREHARQVALSLYGKVKELKIVTLPNVPAKGDVSDWLATFDGDNLNGPYFGIRNLAMAAPDFDLRPRWLVSPTGRSLNRSPRICRQ